MKNISFLGAAGEVTGSSFLLTSQNDEQILIDFGMFQGPRKVSKLNYEPIGFKPQDIKGVLLTHAHLDHCGRLPLLIFGGYAGKIYMTAPTAALVELILNDSAKIAQENMEHEPLFSSHEVQKVLEIIEIVEYNKTFSLGSLNITYKDAGHILGSASIVIEDSINNKRIVFSGDLGNSPEEIVRPTEYIDSANIVVMESTYGDSSHTDEDITQILQEEINIVEKTGGVLLIPAFSLERTQELLHRINHLKKDHKVQSDTPVFLDSPMGIRATIIFKHFKDFYNEELSQHADDPFSFEGFVVTENAKDSKEIIKAMNPKIIIAGSGMMMGGRILHHAVNYLPKDTTRILFVGYQAKETIGRKILEGARNIWIHDTQVKIRAHIKEVSSLSSHADQPKLMKWISFIKNVEKVFLVHGDENQRKVLAEKIKNDTEIKDIILPENMQEFNL